MAERGSDLRFCLRQSWGERASRMGMGPRKGGEMAGGSGTGDGSVGGFFVVI